MNRAVTRDKTGPTTGGVSGSPAGRLARLCKGIGALIVLLAVVVGVPVLMTVLHLVPHSLPTTGAAVTTLKARDNGQLAAGVIAAGVWVCWVLFTLSLLPELAGLARHRPARTLPGLGGFQRPAGALVAAVAIAFTVVPIAVNSGAPPAHAAGLPTPTTHRTTHSISQTINPSTSHTLAPIVGATAQPATTPAPKATDRSTPVTTGYEVQRRDTLWGIAARHLGDPLRYREIAELNRTLVGPDNEITPGTVLQLPNLAAATPKPTESRDATNGAHTVVRVEPGDTLWGIEQHVTGNGDNWPRAWDANRGRSEPDGATFTDPALIRPGWSIDIPLAALSTPGTAVHQKTAHAKPAPERSTPEAAGTVTAPPHQTQLDQAPRHQALGLGQAPAPAHLPPAQPEQQAPVTTAPGRQAPPLAADGGVRGSVPDAVPQGEPASVRRATPDASSELPVLAFAGGGMLLAGVSLTALVAYRRRQFRERRPGRTITGTPAELIGLEQALLATGCAGSADVRWLDQALRSLTQVLAKTDDAQLPDLVAVCMTEQELTLVLATVTQHPPPPWTVDASGTRWSVRRTDQLSYTQDQRGFFFAPFPTLVSVGYTTGGEHWMLDLERIAAMSLSGDEERCLNLMRFLAAELAHNTWSEMLQVTLVGFGRELVGVNPNRLTYTEDATGAIAALNRHRQTVTEAMTDAGVDVLTGRLRDVLGDSWAPNVLLIAPHLVTNNPASTAADTRGLDGLQELLSAMKQQPGRASIALVLTDDPDAPNHADATRWQLTVDSGGILRIPALGLELIAQQIPASEAAGLAQLLALAATGDDQPVPAARGQQPWDDFADACGGLIAPPAPTHSEPDEQSEPAGPGQVPGLHLADSTAWVNNSVLPLSPQIYLEQTATTEQDLQALAPHVDADLREQVARADPELDADLAAWADPMCPRPRLTLLGPVQVRASGQLPERSPQLAFHTEVVAYLATRPAGVLSDRYARAIWPSEPDVVGKTKVRESVSTVRAWLGEDPTTGQKYLPSGSFEAGRARYRINQLLCDAELFRRLRLRGVAYGASGIGDLQRALGLVTGEPFADLPMPRKGAPGGYSWLAEANSRLDHEYAAMIVDVAHIVATHHLAAGEPAAAAAAAQVALRAGSYEDVPLLDLVAACDAQDQRAEADAYVKKILANHDAEVEEDLPPRTAQVLFRRQWTHRAS